MKKGCDFSMFHKTRKPLKKETSFCKTGFLHRRRPWLSIVCGTYSSNSPHSKNQCPYSQASAQAKLSCQVVHRLNRSPPAPTELTQQHTNTWRRVSRAHRSSSTALGIYTPGFNNGSLQLATQTTNPLHHIPIGSRYLLRMVKRR